MGKHEGFNAAVYEYLYLYLLTMSTETRLAHMMVTPERAGPFTQNPSAVYMWGNLKMACHMDKEQ